MGDDYFERELLMWYPKRDKIARIDWNKLMIFSQGWMINLYIMKEKPFYHCKWLKTFPNQITNYIFTQMMRQVLMDCPYIDVYLPISKNDLRVKNFMIEL